MWIVRLCVVAISTWSMSAFAVEPLVIGETYAISEPDVLQEIKSKANQKDWQKELLLKDNNTPKNWSGLTSVRLPRVIEARTRKVKPTHVLEFDITDQSGAVLYPKGYEFNPLEYIQLPMRILVIGDESQQIQWAKEIAKPMDMILTAGGDPIKLTKELRRSVFILEENLRDRLRVESVPSIVSQVADHLLIKEISLGNKNVLENTQKEQ